MKIVTSNAGGFTMSFNTLKLLNALARCGEEQRAKFKGVINPDAPSTKVTLQKDVDGELIEELLATLDITAAQRKRLILLKTDGQDLLKQMLHSTRATYEVMMALQKPGEPNLEFELMGRWYPAEFSFEYTPANNQRGFMQGCAFLSFNYHVVVAGMMIPIRGFITDDMFEDDCGKQRKMTLENILKSVGLRLLENDPQENAERLAKTAKIMGQEPRAYDVRASAALMENTHGRHRLRFIKLGTERAGDMVIVDGKSERELEQNIDNSVVLPLVRVFIMSLKSWGIVDVDDLQEHAYDSEALEKIVLEPKTKGVLSKLFRTPVHRFFGDLLDRRHGGMVICAAGPTGTGKTLTAECYAEETGRILYPLELSELGINPASIEANLQRVFNRVVAWNAVLLIDEGDVLMSKRGDNLEKNAIIAIFLRLLDYYRGVLFITSNRPQDFDEAFAGRITLTLWYPELNEERREQIWRKMLSAAEVELIDGDSGFKKLSAVKINGRQIRNVVRIAEAIDGKQLTSDTLIDMSKFTVEGAMALATRNEVTDDR